MNQTAIVTGAAQGIGKRTAELLLENGFSVALVDLQSTNHVGRDFREKNPVLDFQADISDEKSITDLVTKVEDTWGHIDLLVNNAGISSICPAEQTSTQQFRRVLEINLVEIGRAHV